ncbi:hypothetical protein GCM10023238_23440 [Streptomyces heliomycini]
MRAAPPGYLRPAPGEGSCVTDATEDAMTRTARELLETTAGELAPDPGSNPLVPLIARGEATGPS